MKQLFDSAFYADILNRLNTNICITDTKTDKIVYTNNCMRRTFGLEAFADEPICWKVLQKGMTGRCPFCRIGQLLEDPKLQTCMWRETNTQNGRTYLHHGWLTAWNGRTFYIRNSTDITDQLRLSMQATIDELTGMMNRSAGKQHLEELLLTLDPGEHFTVALYDINGLKWVNDTFGHLEGDRLLCFVAQTIRENLSEPNFAFRLSGDEFIIVFRDQTPDEADSWLRHILHTLEVCRQAAGICYDVTFSYGLARISSGAYRTVSDVLSAADAQMYIQKRKYHIHQG